MKPLSPNNRQRPSRLRHPILDGQYHASESNFRAASTPLKRSPAKAASSFRRLSSGFLNTEMKRDYVAEAFFFAIIVAVSAWPIVPTLRALSALLK